MKKYQDKTSFWYCVKPILLYFGITLCVQSLVLIYIVSQKNIDYTNMSTDELTNIIIDISLSSAAYITIISSAVLIFFGLKLFLPNERNNFDKLYKNTLTIKDILLLILTGYGYYAIVSIIMTILFGVGSSAYSYQEAISSTYGSGVIPTILAVVILQPAAFEVIFRGLIFNRIRAFAKPGIAIFVSASLFSIVGYGSIDQLFYLFGLGIILGYSYTKYENILAPLFIHSAFYAMNFIMLIKPVFDFMETKIGMYVFYCAGFAAIVTGLNMIKKHPFPPKKREDNIVAAKEEIR